MSESPLADPQARENPDPHEKGNPIPTLLLVAVIAAFIWAIGYIFLNQRDDPPELGDNRTIETLRAAQSSSARAIDGAQLYAAQCSACHQASGAGLPGVFPPLADSEWVVGSERVLINIVLHGVTGELSVKGANYSGQMPAFKDKLNDAEIAAVLSYIRTNFRNSVNSINQESVKSERALSGNRTTPWNGNEDLNKLARE